MRTATHEHGNVCFADDYGLLPHDTYQVKVTHFSAASGNVREQYTRTVEGVSPSHAVNQAWALDPYAHRFELVEVAQ